MSIKDIIRLSFFCGIFLKICNCHANNFSNINDSLLVRNSRLIIDYCNKADSVKLLKLLKIKTINSEPADNNIFWSMVSSFNQIGKKNKILADSFFEESDKYCYTAFSKKYVLVVGKEAHVFEFNSEGKLNGIYLCTKVNLKKP